MSKIGQLVRSRMVWIVLGLVLGYTAMSAVVSTHYLITMMHAVVFFVSLAVVAYYLPAVIPTILRGRGSREECLILGIVLTWGSTAVVRLWSSVYRVLDRPEWMFENAIFGFLLMTAIVGGVLHLTAPHVQDGRVPAARWREVLAILVLGVVSAAAIAYIDDQLLTPPLFR